MTGGPRGAGRFATFKEERGMELGNSLAHFAAGIGAGLAIIGGAAGIGRLAAAAMDGTARQPQEIGRASCRERVCYVV